MKSSLSHRQQQTGSNAGLTRGKWHHTQTQTRAPALHKLHYLKQGFTRGPKRTATKGPVHQFECSTLNSNVEQVLGLGLHYLASVSNSSMITVLHSRFSTKNDSIRVR